MLRKRTVLHGSRRFGIAHPHELNRISGYRGGVRK
ncbi:hypothetical protein [Microvirus mar26]|uniref:Uncharacterized protein n=2 Tax=unclassified Microviridae TaxID=117574 RepID=A0A8F5RC03_9VIRU|nr:hypothetical protein [Microvirus mar24]QXN75118.1 hypothetical protein [Microvirus mar26]